MIHTCSTPPPPLLVCIRTQQQQFSPTVKIVFIMEVGTALFAQNPVQVTRGVPVQVACVVSSVVRAVGDGDGEGNGVHEAMARATVKAML
jgi:hypothetical protein